MSRPVRTLAAAVGLAAIVGACAGAPRLYHEQITPNYTVSQYNYAAGRRDFLTVVRGDPFNMGEPAFQDAVIEVLNRNQPWPQPTHFTATPGESARTEYSTVLLFDVPTAMTSNAICRAGIDGQALAADGPRAANGLVRVAAAFCWGRGALTSVVGEVNGVEAVADPKFEALIGQLVYRLFPLDDRRDRCPPFTLGC